MPSPLYPAPSPLRFALVGCGAIASTHARAINELSGIAQLTHCSDVLPQVAQEFAAKHQITYSTWSELLANPSIDAISLCTPSGLHGELAAQALHAGKHVIVEKPMEISLAACDLVIAAQKSSGKKFGVISQHRFDPDSVKLHQILSDGRLGRLISVETRVPWYRTQNYYDSGAWRGTWAMDGGGCLMNQGIHTLDLMLWFCGPVREVYARALTAAHERIEVEDTLCATLTFANGAIGTLFASTSAYPGFPANLSLYGTKGSAVLSGDELQSLDIQNGESYSAIAGSAHARQVAAGGTRSAVHHADEAAKTGATTPWKWGDAHRAQFADFAAAIRDNRPPLVDGQAGRDSVALILAIYESSRTGQPIRLAT